MAGALPVIDIAPLGGDPDTPAARQVAAEIDAACREHGFFLVAGHGVDPALERRLDTAARRFFALPDAEKARVAMPRHGAAWRGWFPVGGELTSGRPDHKEGLYLGEDLPADDPRVRAGVPLHGANPAPSEPVELVPAIGEWLVELRRVALTVLRGISLALGLAPDALRQGLCDPPTVLLRLFHYPPVGGTDGWGVGEHTDYGLLTVLRQDDTGGLQVHRGREWVDVPTVAGTFVCNLGDMLEALTGGRYRSTPHRVRPVRDATGPDGVGRISIPFFLDPGWDVTPEPIATSEPTPPARARWDGEDPLGFAGTYGQYLTSRVARVFPHLFADVVDGTDPPDV